MNRTATARPARSKGWIVGGVIAAVVALAVVISIVATGGGDDTPVGVEQTRPVVISGGALPQYTDPGNDSAIGLTAPALSGQSFDGSAVEVETGQPTLLVFLAHWCPHCQREVPLLTEWSENGEVPDGAQVIGIATSTTPERPNYPPSEWLERERFPFPVIADSDTFQAAETFGLTGFPYFVVLDASGKVVARATGEVETSVLTELLEQAAP
jgi:thiol-disulfide isomerase/thioredoxin